MWCVYIWGKCECVLTTMNTVHWVAKCAGGRRGGLTRTHTHTKTLSNGPRIHQRTMNGYSRVLRMMRCWRRTMCEHFSYCGGRARSRRSSLSDFQHNHREEETTTISRLLAGHTHIRTEHTHTHNTHKHTLLALLALAPRYWAKWGDSRIILGLTTHGYNQELNYCVYARQIRGELAGCGSCFIFSAATID